MTTYVIFFALLSMFSFLKDLWGDLTGANARRDASRADASATNIQQQQLDRELEEKESLTKLFRRMQASGFFNVDRRIGEANEASGKRLKRTLTSLAASDRIRGVRPGESAPGRREAHVIALDRDQGALREQEIRDRVGTQEFAFKKAIGVGGGSASSNLSALFSNQAATARANAPSVLGMVSAFQPFLQRRRQTQQGRFTSGIGPGRFGGRVV